MDLDHIKAHGVSTTRTAWATNPVRRVLWWLVAPYFRGTSMEIEWHRSVEGANLRQEAALTSALLRQEAVAAVDGLRQEFALTDASQRQEIAALRQEIVALPQEIMALRQEI